MKHLDEKYIKEICQLIKSLLTFCKYELIINKGEINLTCSVKDLTKILLFLKDNPSLDGMSYRYHSCRFRKQQDLWLSIVY